MGCNFARTNHPPPSLRHLGIFSQSNTKPDQHNFPSTGLDHPFAAMEGAFTHLGNHLISDSGPTINAGDDLSTIDPDESLLEGEYGRTAANAGPQRRRHDDDDDATEAFDDDDTESMASMAVDGIKGRAAARAEEEKELPAHACA